MTALPKKATFTPLSGGWYRCNQTGERLRKDQIGACRRQVENSGRKPVPAIEPFRIVLPITTGTYVGWPDYMTEFVCPTCMRVHIEHGRFIGNVQCRYCDTKFTVKLA